MPVRNLEVQPVTKDSRAALIVAGIPVEQLIADKELRSVLVYIAATYGGQGFRMALVET